MAISLTSQATAFAEANLAITSSVMTPLRPHLTGGHARLFRYDDSSEKPLISLGEYDKDNDTTYDWPNLPATGLVDLSYVKLYGENVLLRYFSDAIGAGDTFAKVTGYSNRVKATTTVFQSNSYASRTALFYDRDVAIGDAVYLTNGSVELWTKVTGLIPNVVAASVAAATSGSGNAGTQSASSSINQTAGTSNDVSASASIAAYRGFKDGSINETYTITVTQGATTPGDATSAILSVTSASGLDNQASVVPAIYGRPTRIGTRGATVTFTRTSDDLIAGQVWTLTIAQAFTAVTGTSGGTFTGPRDLTYLVTITRGGVAGAASPLANPSTQATVNVTGGGAGGSLPAGDYYVSYTWNSTEGETTAGTSQSAQFTATGTDIPRVTIPALPTGATSANIYLTDTGGATGTGRLYRRNVTTTTVDLDLASYDGGTFANSIVAPTSSTATTLAPQITAVDTTGFDASGPTSVGGGLSVNVGSYGVTLTFSGAALRAGDTYQIVATATSDGAVQTLVLRDNLPSALLAAVDLTLKLYIETDLVLPEKRLDSPPDVNYVAIRESLTVNGGMTAFDSSYTNGGVPVALPVEYAELYAHYRVWLPEHTGAVTFLDDAADIPALLGTIHPDNPLAYAASKALASSNGYGLYFTAVADPENHDDWLEVLTILDRLEDVFGLVPLTTDQTIIDAWIAHAEAQSSDDISCPRMVWSVLPLEETYVLVDATTTSDEEVAVATLTDNPDAAGTQYTLLTCTSGNAKFLTNGIRAGDEVRYLYGIDAFGETTYSSFLVLQVINEDELLLQAGHTAAVNVAQRFEIWRSHTRTELASSLADFITARSSAYWLPLAHAEVYDGDWTVPGYYLLAELAALAGGVAPQQTLRHMEILGFDGIAYPFNNGQLNTLEAAGAVTLASNSSGQLYVRRARTADQSSPDTAEESAMRLLSAIKLAAAGEIRQHVGRANVAGEDQGAVPLLRTRLQYLIERLQRLSIDGLGSIVLAGSTVDTVRPVVGAPDQVLVQLTINRPYALGKTTLLIVVGGGS